MALTDVDICTTALLLIGADEISTFSDATREAKICKAVYETTKGGLLQSHPWRFAVNQVELNKLAAVPLFGFTAAFQLPADYLRLIDRFPAAPDYRIFEDKIYSNVNELKITYAFSPPEHRMPAYFVRALEFDLARLLATAVLEDSEKARVYDRLLENQLRLARVIDSQNSGGTTTAPHTKSYLAVRG
jgi:hypothetical protein|tara:strand:+ start:625 stop:1188 length:564 start_codon:yes stop_codon:yes gene_type:complete